LVGYERLLTTVETLTRTQDQYAQIKGNLSKSVILLYKALGGGWQISKGKSYISKELAEKMKGRIDWGRYLDKSMTKIPESLE
jgi:ribosomal protein S19